MKLEQCSHLTVNIKYFLLYISIAVFYEILITHATNSSQHTLTHSLTHPTLRTIPADRVLYGMLYSRLSLNLDVVQRLIIHWLLNKEC